MILNTDLLDKVSCLQTTGNKHWWQLLWVAVMNDAKNGSTMTVSHWPHHTNGEEHCATPIIQPDTTCAGDVFFST